MERRAKERLIGASILVVLVVLIVPELLSGPKPSALHAGPQQILPAPANPGDPVRNVTLDLATSKPAAVEADAGGASTAALPDASQSAAPAATPPQPMPAPSAVESQPPLPSASKGDWAVQLGSFASRGNADSLMRKLKAQEFAAYVSPIGAGRAERYRVRVGPFGDRAAAERNIARLKSTGHQGSLVTPTRQ